MKNITETRICPDAEQVARQAMDFVLEQAQQAISAKGRFVLCLAGGSTPKRLYQLLAEQDIDYSQWYLLYGDERCLPEGDTERNSTMVRENWLNNVEFPQAQHLAMPAELGPFAGAEAYQTSIQSCLPIDLCLLGVGEDGHTASLFPDHQLQEGDVIGITNSPKPPPERVSLNYSVINQSDCVCILMTGVGKQQALNQWKQGEALPVSLVHGKSSTVLWLDQELAASLG